MRPRRLHRRVKRIHTPHVQPAAIDFRSTANIQNIKTPPPKTQIGRLPRSHRQYRIDPTQLVHYLYPESGSDIHPPFAVALEPVRPRVLLVVRHMEPAIALLIIQRSVRTDGIDPNPVGSRLGNIHKRLIRR